MYSYVNYLNKERQIITVCYKPTYHAVPVSNLREDWTGDKCQNNSMRHWEQDRQYQTQCKG